jgi:hypothetical protein
MDIEGKAMSALSDEKRKAEQGLEHSCEFERIKG